MANKSIARIPASFGRNQDGKTIGHTDFAGKGIILYFYPKDNTSGCTAEACSLRDHYKELLDAGYDVVGVSPDSEASHRKFIDKHQLPFQLIADTDHSLAEKLGAWGEKSLYGRKYMGILRSTFVIDHDGNIIAEMGPKQIKTKIHAEQLLDLLKNVKK